ncbi:MAG: nucleotidyltransferase domain-containing protein [Kiritimatiellales bacterium]|nr:nucleotidyltransferase domain-containing protein [Kiritimatiellota bacterium]MBL7016160.1 nucleotidyltransferase domain-containing protein [Kiritimatiellales bacterium]
MIQKANIAGINPEELHRLGSVFEQEPNLREVILYGSRAKGTHRPGSDIDLTLKGTALTTAWLMDLSAKIDDLLLPYEVDLSIFEHIDNPDLIEHISRVGKVVFSNE